MVVGPPLVVVQRDADRGSASATDLAADYKAHGLDREAAYDRFVIERGLAPEMGKREFTNVFERVAPSSLDRAEEVPFCATHRDTFLDRLVEVTPTRYGHALVWDFGMTGGEPGSLPDRYQPLSVSREALMAWGYESAQRRGLTATEKHALRRIIDRWITRNGTPPTHELHAAGGRSAPRFYWTRHVASRWWRRYGQCVGSA